MKKVKSATALFMVILTVIMLFSSCSSAEKLKLSETVRTEKAADEYHIPSQETETISKNNYVNFLFDKKTFTVSIKDITENYTWNSLCGKNTDVSYAFGLTLFTDNGIYELNTQDNSVAFGTAEYEKKNDSVTVKYVLSDNKSTALKNYDEITKNDVYAAFSVKYSFSQQSMSVTADLGNALLTPGSFITDFEFLPCLGSSDIDSAEDYFLFPDGSGAILHLDKSDGITDSVTSDIYGSDPYLNKTEKTASGTVPVFGVKRGNSAFAAIITKGDALATVRAERMTQDKPSHINSVFSITPVIHASSGNTVFKGATYNGNVSVIYKFISGVNATYTSMASSAREEFINNSLIKSTKTDAGTDIPFCLTVVGESSSETLTTTGQTLDILGILKGKGINNILLDYKGLLSGGQAQKDLYSATVNKRLGGKSGLESLYEYTKKQGCRLVIGTNIFSSSRLITANREKTIDGKYATTELINDMSFDANLSDNLISRIGTQASQLGKDKATPTVYDSTESFRMYLRSLSTVDFEFPLFLESDIPGSADGISVSDAGRILYSTSETDRETAKNMISDHLRSVSNYGNLTVEGGNLYSLYSAELVSTMEFGTFYKESSGYEPVPFVPAILHGYTFYTGEAIDAGDPLYRYEMLRYIEYGALPAYEWIYADKNIFCYSGYLLSERANEIADFYNDFIEIFSPLTDETIVSHKKIEKNSDGKQITGVYCTTYSDGTEIYVNYTGSIISTPENIAIGPYDYVAVKR